MVFTLIGYDPTGMWTETMTGIDELADWVSSAGNRKGCSSPEKPAGVTWIHAEGFDQPDEMNRLADIFGIHALTVEDILDTTHQRPKVEEFDDYLFIALKAVNPLADFELEHIGLVITSNTVLTFLSSDNNYLEGIRKRILSNAGRLRRMGADYLVYAIMDAVVDEYFVSIDLIGSQIEDFEDRALAERDDSFIHDIQQLKRELLKMRRAVWPLRESLSLMMHLDSKQISDGLVPFFKDVYEHVIQAAETIETFRELIAGIMEINMTVASNRLSQVMKVLTIISTIFIPLTFIAGVYGMNFHYMPELEMAPAYFIVLGVMATVALGMLFFFKRRKWI